MDKILLFTDIPIFENHELSDRELECITHSIRQFEIKGDFELVNEAAINEKDFRTCLSDKNYNIIHFTNSSNNQKGIKVRSRKDAELIKYISKDSFDYCFRSLKDNTICVILNGDSSEELAAETAKFIDFSIGTIREINKDEAIQFSEEFYKHLAKERYVIDRTILDAFYEGMQQALMIGVEYPYVLFTKKITSKTMKKKELPAVEEIRTEADYKKITKILDDLEQKQNRVNALSKELPNTGLHSVMQEWLQHALEERLRTIIHTILPNATTNEQDDFLAELENIMYKIDWALKFNKLDPIRVLDVPLARDPKLYRLALKKLDQEIPREGNFTKNSRYFLSKAIKFQLEYL